MTEERLVFPELVIISLSKGSHVYFKNLQHTEQYTESRVSSKYTMC